MAPRCETRLLSGALQALVTLHKEQFHEYQLQVARDYVTQAGVIELKRDIITGLGRVSHALVASHAPPISASPVPTEVMPAMPSSQDIRRPVSVGSRCQGSSYSGLNFPCSPEGREAGAHRAGVVRSRVTRGADRRIQILTLSVTS